MDRVNQATSSASKSRQSIKSETGSEWDADYDEPELEFDEIGTALEAKDVVLEDNVLDDDFEHDNSTVHLPFQLTQELESDDKSPFHSSAISADGLVDEDFEEELGRPTIEDNTHEMEFIDIAKYNIIQMAGDDTLGRKVIVFSACKLPDRTQLDHDRLLLYLKYTLDQYVENDYTLVYFHYGLCSSNKPTFRWLRQAYREFDRKYKKNLKALYIIHASNFIKVVWTLFKKLISGKFHEKVFNINYLHELAQHLQLDQLQIPQLVKDYDALQLARKKPTPVPTSIIHAPLPAQQFGVSLEFIKEHNGGETIPRILQQCVDYIRQHCLDKEGIFRRSANAKVLREVQEELNRGQRIDFGLLQDEHIPEAMLKSFLRQLPEPLLTYDLYDHIVHVQSLSEMEKLQEMRRLLHDELPENNFAVLKYLLEFLTEVSSRCSVNRMTQPNLAVVFGPNLMWSKTQASLATIGSVNACALLMIAHYHELFDPIDVKQQNDSMHKVGPSGHASYSISSK